MDGNIPKPLLYLLQAVEALLPEKLHPVFVLLTAFPIARFYDNVDDIIAKEKKRQKELVDNFQRNHL